MSTLCYDDTDSVDLTQTVDGHLQARVRLGDTSLAVSSAGVSVNVSPDPSNKLLVRGDGLFVADGSTTVRTASSQSGASPYVAVNSSVFPNGFNYGSTNEGTTFGNGSATEGFMLAKAWHPEATSTITNPSADSVMVVLMTLGAADGVSIIAARNSIIYMAYQYRVNTNPWVTFSLVGIRNIGNSVINPGPYTDFRWPNGSVTLINDLVAGGTLNLKTRSLLVWGSPLTADGGTQRINGGAPRSTLFGIGD